MHVFSSEHAGQHRPDRFEIAGVQAPLDADGDSLKIIAEVGKALNHGTDYFGHECRIAVCYRVVIAGVADQVELIEIVGHAKTMERSCRVDELALQSLGAQPSIIFSAVKVLLAALRSTLTAETEGWVFWARGKCGG